MTVHDAESPAPLLGLVRELRWQYRRRGGSPPQDRDAVGAYTWWSSLDGLPRHPPNARQRSRGIATGNLRRGWCIWCHRRCASDKHWHPVCGAQYQAARGLTVGFYGPLIERGPCVECGANGTEIDHRLSIGVARALGYRWHIRAYLLSNLRWLCEPCHRSKTRRDTAALATLRRADAIRAQLDRQWPLLLPPPAPDQPDLPW